MQQYFENIKDYKKERFSRLKIEVLRIMPSMIFIGIVMVMFFICGHLEVM
nr:hypothetical protein [uncultured Clostridium sp.]